MADLDLKTTDKGTLVQSITFEGMDFIVNTFNMMADPVLDDAGIEIVQRMAADAGLVLTDSRSA